MKEEKDKAKHGLKIRAKYLILALRFRALRWGEGEKRRREEEKKKKEERRREEENPCMEYWFGTLVWRFGIHVWNSCLKHLFCLEYLFKV